MGIVIVIERNLLCTMVSFRKKHTMDKRLGSFREITKKIFFSKRTKNKLEKMFFFYSERAFFFEQTLNTIIERTIL